jgi:hypothetical protein
MNANKGEKKKSLVESSEKLTTLEITKAVYREDHHITVWSTAVKG